MNREPVLRSPVDFILNSAGPLAHARSYSVSGWIFRMIPHLEPRRSARTRNCLPAQAPGMDCCNKHRADASHATSTRFSCENFLRAVLFIVVERRCVQCVFDVAHRPN